jgi:ATP-dependent Zn protease
MPIKKLTLFLLGSLQTALSLSPTPVPPKLLNVQYYPKTSFNNLISQIDNDEITDIYVSNTMDTIFSKQKEPQSDDIDSVVQFRQDYSITKVNPFIIKTVVDESVKHKVNTVFLEKSTNFFDYGTQAFLGITDSIIFPAIFISIVISFFRRANMGENFQNNLPGMPGLNNKRMDADKLLVSKTNITLNSFAGSPELFEECTEVISYLKNNTLYKNAGAEIPRGILL